MPPRFYPRLALVLLTALNLLNYIDRSVLFAVQPLVQAEFHRSNAEFGFLTTAFFLCYMIAAPIMGALADRYSRKPIMVAGAVVWSGATMLTAMARSFETLLVRHTVVGIGEASFVTIAPAFLADLFGEERRGRILAVFYTAIPLGTALGYVIGGHLGTAFGWRAPFYVAGAPGFLLALGLMFIPDPPRGQKDSLRETVERATVLGLTRNGAYLTASLGMATMTFALGGLSVWMPTFLSGVRGYPLGQANLVFGLMTAFNGIVATLLGGWLGDRLLRRTAGAYYAISAASMAFGLPVMIVAVYTTGATMFPGLFLAEFLLLLNTAPLNAAIVNSVGAHIRSTAIAINIFVIHLLGDALSPWVIGYLADRRSLQAGFMSAVVAVALSSAVLFYGMRFAPQLRVETIQPRAGGIRAG